MRTYKNLLEIIIFVSLIGFGHSKISDLKWRKPNFTLIQENNSNDNEIPNIEIMFPDGSSDTLVLHRYYSNKMDQQKNNIKSCNFIGYLKNETDACVGLSGCPGKENVEFLILSTRLENPAYKWRSHIDGYVQRLPQVKYIILKHHLNKSTK